MTAHNINESISFTKILQTEEHFCNYSCFYWGINHIRGLEGDWEWEREREKEGEGEKFVGVIVEEQKLTQVYGIPVHI